MGLAFDVRENIGDAWIITAEDVVKIISNLCLLHVAVMLDDAGASAFDVVLGVDVVLCVIKIALRGNTINVAMVVPKSVVSCWYDAISVDVIIVSWVSVRKWRHIIVSTMRWAKQRISLHLPTDIGDHLITARVRILGALAY